jgi:hypothetical protein
LLFFKKKKEKDQALKKKKRSFELLILGDTHCVIGCPTG